MVRSPSRAPPTGVSGSASSASRLRSGSSLESGAAKATAPRTNRAMRKAPSDATRGRRTGALS